MKQIEVVAAIIRDCLDIPFAYAWIVKQRISGKWRMSKGKSWGISYIYGYKFVGNEYFCYLCSGQKCVNTQKSLEFKYDYCKRLLPQSTD